jgi:hypothetical protein
VQALLAVTVVVPGVVTSAKVTETVAPETGGGVNVTFVPVGVLLVAATAVTIVESQMAPAHALTVALPAARA